jgi:lectin-like protein
MFETTVRTPMAKDCRAKAARLTLRRGLHAAAPGWLALVCACTELADPEERGLEPSSPVSPAPLDERSESSDDLSGGSTARVAPAPAEGDGGPDGAASAALTPDATADAPGPDAGSPADASDRPGIDRTCPADLRFGPSCYRPSQVPLSWDDARTDCLAGGADLVSIGSGAEDAFVAALLPQSVWLGASDRALQNVFAWATNGAELSFSSWGPGQPDAFPGQDCVEKRQEPGEPWYDQTCESLLFYVCERSLVE